MTVPAPTRTALLALHRALVDAERRDYEKVHGPVNGSEFLQVLIQDPAFAWLGPLTRLIAQLDDDELDDARSMLAALRALLSFDPEVSEFQRRYAERIDRDPNVAVAHGIARAEVRRRLNPKPTQRVGQTCIRLPQGRRERLARASGLPSTRPTR